MDGYFDRTKKTFGGRGGGRGKVDMPKGKRKSLGNAKRYKKIVVPKTVVGGIVLYSTARVTDATDEERVRTEEKTEECFFGRNRFWTIYLGKKKKKGEICAVLVRFLRFKS